MADADQPMIVIPGDDPPQIAGSPHLDRLRHHGEVRLYETSPESDEEKVRRAHDARVIVNSRGQVKWPGHVLRQLPKLKMMTTCGVGTDSIGLKTAKELGIVVSNVPGKTAFLVAEHAFALLLAVSRRMAYYTAQLKAGHWPQMLSTSLQGRTLGVVGTGNIGCQMIHMASAAGMRIIAWSFHPSPEKAEQLGFRYVSLDQLLTQSDAVSLHCKLTEDSRGLIGERELGMMKAGSLLVNTSRGEVVDTSALVAALKSEHLGGAGLDVYDQEPLPADHPLFACQQVVLTPHCADQTAEGIDILNTGCVDNVIAFLEGRPQNVVTSP